MYKLLLTFTQIREGKSICFLDIVSKPNSVSGECGGHEWLNQAMETFGEGWRKAICIISLTPTKYLSISSTSENQWESGRG